MFALRRWIKVMLPLAVALLLLLGAVGCGPSAEEEVAEEEGVAEEDVSAEEEVVAEEEEPLEEEIAEAPVAVDNWRNPTGVSEIVNNFEEMEWRWAQMEDGEETGSTVVHYRYAGSETVEGVEADILAFSVDDDEFKLWVDEQGDAVQGEFDGNIIPGALVEAGLEGFISAIFWPYWTFEEFGVREALAETTPGIELRVVSTGREQFGEISADVTRMEVEVGPPFTPEGEVGTLTWSVGDFDGDFQMIVEWGGTEVTSEDDYGVTYSLRKVVPR